MGYVRYSNNVFLGKYELVSEQNFIRDEGYQKFIKDTAVTYGLINNSVGGDFQNAKIIEGAGNNTIRHNSILGIDVDGKFFAKESSSTDISVGTGSADTQFYWVKAVRAESNLESGTINISFDGTITGVGTDFLSSLRSASSDFPTRIRFPNSTVNTGEYDVVEVIDDLNANLNVVSLTSEANQEWQIVPTSTPGAVLTTDEKKLFNYDDAEITLVPEVNLILIDGFPQSVSGEYWLARVQNNGNNVVIEDKRDNYLYRSIDGYSISTVDKDQNPLIGVEAIKYTATSDTRTDNIVEASFTMRSDNWTYDSNLNRVTIIAGQGGKFKSTSDFTDGDFDGWRLYYKSGNYSIINQSSLSGTQINLSLDILNPSELSDNSQQLVIAPDISEMEFIFESSSVTPLSIVRQSFPANTDLCRIKIPVTDSTSDYTVKYRSRHIKDYGEIFTVPDDTNGYYNESQFNADGSLIVGATRTPYTSGVITLTQSSDAYINQITDALGGDRFGINITELDNSNPLTNLVPRTNERRQIFDHSSNSISLSVDNFINLDGSTAIDGSTFLIDFRGTINLNGFQLRVVENYVNTSTFDEIINLSQDKLDKALSNNIQIRFQYDSGTSSWVYYEYNNELTSDVINATSGTNGSPSSTNQFVTDSDPRNSDSRNPNGVAGGDLSGSYPNPTINNEAFSSRITLEPDLVAASSVTVNKDPLGWVNVDGVISTDIGVPIDSSSFTTIGTLDSGYRITTVPITFYNCVALGNAVNFEYCLLRISDDGLIQIRMNQGTTGASLWTLYVTGIRFR